MHCRAGICVFTLVAVALVMGCARMPAPVVVEQELAPAATGSHDVVMRQLRAHLDRARVCLSQARSQDRDVSGFVEAELTIGVDGRVQGTHVTHNTSGNDFLGRCIEQKLSALYFDPAPAEPITWREPFMFCRPGDGELCELGLPSPRSETAGSVPVDAVAAGLRAQSARVLACAREQAPGREAVISVELTVGTDGRISSGWVRDTFPSTTPLRDCAVRPLLGVMLDGVELQEATAFRYSFGVRSLAGEATTVSSR